ncbi:hypothetical protein GCWU000341_01137 [Oribacterium sp. oral taxon 078 str. F0262]|nr:hypothetical protein GCWU000341_01137 [Oribacterium sp. oral taxon 078 str. F0262]
MSVRWSRKQKSQKHMYEQVLLKKPAVSSPMLSSVGCSIGPKRYDFAVLDLDFLS